ncbi:MAG: tetratricopeptide repeat protein, partial [Deltaproteobacteria bacterium]
MVLEVRRDVPQVSLGLAVGLTLLAALVSYANVFPNAFVWDDEYFILTNRGLWDHADFREIFTTPVHNLYRPVRTLAYAAAYRLFGTEPLGYHANCLFWHTVNTLLVLLIGWRLFSPFVALLSALLFAVHPVHTDRVTIMVGGFELFGEFFFLLALWLEVRARRASPSAWLVFLVGVFTSEMTITLPAIVFLVHRFGRGRSRASALKRALPFAGIALFFLYVRFFVVHVGARVGGYPEGSFPRTMLTMLEVFARYWGLLLYPHGLRAIYEIPLVRGFSLPLLFSGILHVGLLVGAWMAARRGISTLTLGILWVYTALLPVSNLVPTGTLMAERYLYLASVGFCWIFGDLTARIWRRSRPDRGIVAITVTGLLILFSLATMKRNTVWRSSFTLWQDTIRKSPTSAIAHNNLGNAYRRKGEKTGNVGMIRRAIEEHERALELDPTFLTAASNLGNDYLTLGDLDAAERYFQRAVALAPELAVAHYNLALTRFKRGALAEARVPAERAVELAPREKDYRLLLARLLDRLGEVASACRHYAIYLSLERGATPNRRAAERRLEALSCSLSE